MQTEWVVMGKVVRGEREREREGGGGGDGEPTESNWPGVSRLCLHDVASLMLLLVGCLTSQQHASVSQGRICSITRVATLRRKLHITPFFISGEVFD